MREKAPGAPRMLPAGSGIVLRRYAPQGARLALWQERVVHDTRWRRHLDRRLTAADSQQRTIALVEPVGRTVWAIERTPDRPAVAPLRLLISTHEGRTWRCGDLPYGDLAAGFGLGPLVFWETVVLRR